MKSRRRNGVVFSLSIVGLLTELRLSGDAMNFACCENCESETGNNKA